LSEIFTVAEVKAQIKIKFSEVKSFLQFIFSNKINAEKITGLLHLHSLKNYND
jgi:hypothetical protein